MRTCWKSSGIAKTIQIICTLPVAEPHQIRMTNRSTALWDRHFESVNTFKLLNSSSIHSSLLYSLWSEYESANILPKSI